MWLGVSCFVASGNGDDTSSAGYGSAATAFSTQGSSGYNRNLRENELASSAAKARQLKELKASMATISPAQQKYSTAEEFLAANRPPMPPPGSSPSTPQGRRNEYVPEFNAQSAGNSSRQVSSDAGLPAKEGNLFGWLKRPKNSESSSQPPSGGGGESNPYTDEGISEQEAVPPVEYERAAVDLPSSSSGRNGNGLLSRWFGKKDEPLPAEIGAPVPTEPVAGELSDSQDSGGGLPETPQWVEEASPAPAPVESSIFVNRDSSSAGKLVTVSDTTQADVEGVRVMLYQGTQVNLISKSGDRASIKLPDQRVGTVELSALNL